MSKLYPPILESTLPAFSSEIRIPFALGLGTGWDDFSNVCILIKNGYSNDQIGVLTLAKNDTNIETKDDGTYEIKVTVPSPIPEDSDLSFLSGKQGQYFKIQVALKKGTEIGHYSSVGVIRYVAAPTMSIDVQSNYTSFVGTYTYSNLEKAHSYQFNLYEDNQLIATSGKLIHNSLNDTAANKSEDSWENDIIFKSKSVYKIEYVVTSVNGLISSTETTIEHVEGASPTLGEVELKVEFNFEEGYNRVYLSGTAATVRNKVLIGNFILLRASEKTNFVTWEKLTQFKLNGWKYYDDIKNIYKDYCIEPGVKYKYAIQAYGKITESGETTYIYTSKYISNYSYGKNLFEDCFLFDGERQLKIRFNPKIGNLKDTILETKVDTLGGKQPYFYRNGKVKYKEFTISGLVSLLTDQNGEFLKMEELPSEDFFSLTSLEEFNFNREKEFKLSVLDWLNNGKPKLFKSPAEGNYIVRLMNASLAPQESLGRMLHTFSCTAYEIADYNLKNLKEHKFLPEEILFEQEENTYNFTNTSKSVSLSGTISHMALYGIPGTLFTCSYTSGGVNKTENKTIPNSGIYIFSKEELNKRYKQISFASSVSITTNEFYLTYISKASTSLATIKATSISTENISTTSGDSKTLGKNFRGYGVYFLEDDPSIINSEKNIIKSTESTDSTTKTKIDYEGFYGRIFRKPEIEVIKDSNGKYRNESGNEITSWSVNNLYKLVSENGEAVEKYYAIASTGSSSNSPTFRNSVDWFAIHNGEEYLDHLQSGYYIVKDFNQLYLGKGLMCTVYGLEKTTISTLPGEGEANKIYAL